MRDLILILVGFIVGAGFTAGLYFLKSDNQSGARPKSGGGPGEGGEGP